MATKAIGEFSWERMIGAVEKVRERVLRTAKALEDAGIPYAIAGGNAVAAWVSRVDETAVRNTADVDVILRRCDFPAAINVMSAAGFVHVRSMEVEMFLDGPDGSPRDAVHVLFAGEKVKPQYTENVPSVDDVEPMKGFKAVPLERLVRMKLTSFRRKDQVHLLDMLDIGLIDASWKSRFAPELAARLQELIDTPEG